MTKGIKVLIVILLILVGTLSGTSGYLYAKLANSTTKEASLKSVKTTDTKSETPAKTSNPASETKTATTSAVTSPAPLGDRPSSPSDTYTVQQGETLFAIGQKVDLSWLEIVAANGIADADKVKSGQLLIIPKNNQVSFTINSEKAKSIQTKVDGGASAFRLKALDTAKSDSSPVYGITPTDTFSEIKSDLASGTASILVTKESKKYELKLTQPVTKGEKGIWAIESIKQVTE